MKFELQNRIIENKDWIFGVFLFALMLIVIVKNNFENRFFEFTRIFISDKYTKIYRDGTLIMSWFTVILFFVQVISFSFFIMLIMQSMKISVFDWIVFIQVFTALFVFILAKLLIEKIIGTTFEIEDFVEQYNMYKVSVRTYISLLLLPINIILIYNQSLSNVYINAIIVTLLFVNSVFFIKSIKLFQKTIISGLIYFILYLCTLEIMPYYFIYRLITHNNKFF